MKTLAEAVRDAAAQASGATLGYIVGGVPGSITGYKLARSYTESMQHRLKRKRGLNVHTKRTKWTAKKIRGKAKVFIRSGKRQKVARGSKVGSLRKAVAHYPRKSHTKQLGKRLRISRKFRKRVIKVLTQSKYKGYFQYNSYSFFPANVSPGGQFIHQPAAILVTDGQNTTANSAAPLFSPTIFARIAEGLWGAAPLPDSSPNPLIIPVGTADDNSMAMMTAKIPIIDSWMKYCIKNNSNNTVEIKMYICKPKMRSSYYRYLNPTTDTLNDQGHVVNPIDDWSTALELLRRPLVSGYGTTVLSARLKGQASTDLTPYDGIRTYGMDPRQFHWFNKHWKTDVVKFKVYPGQCIEKVVRGPRDILMDMQKLWRNPYQTNTSPVTVSTRRPAGWSFEEVQKWNRYVFFTSAPEINLGQTGSVGQISCGRYPNPVQYAEGQVIGVEAKMYVKLGKPENLMRYNEAEHQGSLPLIGNMDHDVYYLQNEIAPLVTSGFVSNTQNSGVIVFSNPT